MTDPLISDFIAPMLVAIVVVVLFGSAMALSRVVVSVQKLADFTVAGLSAMLDSSLNDTEKENAVRRAGIVLLTTSCQVAWRFILVLTCAALPILMFDAAGLVRMEKILRFLMRLDFIIIMSILGILVATTMPARGNPDSRCYWG